MIGPVEALFVALPVALAVFLGIGIYRAGSGLEPDRWAADHGITLTDKTRSMVADYLTRSRRLRLAGALLGLAIPLGTRIPGLEMIGGYLLGALYAEFTHKRLVAQGEPVASLSPRGLSDYVPHWVPLVLRSLAVTGAGLLAIFEWGPARAEQPLDVESAVVLATGIASFVTPFVVESLLRRMASRAQPASSPETIAADDAIRSASMHAAAGAGIAVTLLFIAALMWAVGVTSDLQPIRWIFPFLGLGCGFAAVSMWLSLGPGTPWKVNRSISTSGVMS